MQRSQVKLVIASSMLFMASAGWAVGQTSEVRVQASGAVVSGIVRDAQGIAQMGALIQVITSNSVAAASTFTDLHGRYVIANLTPGKYYVRASAALFVPAMRDNLLLRSGGKTVVNLTLSTLFETSAWIPAERRKADEPGDDWKWTLRSAANRPILRMVEDGQMVLVSSSATETAKPVESAKDAVTAGDGSFAEGGVHNVIALNRELVDGADVRMRIDIGSGLGQGTPPVGRPSVEVQTGYQKQLGFAGAVRTVASYQSHPELMGTGHVPGLDSMQFATAQKMQFGDMAELEAGSAVVVIRAGGYATAARPFVRLAVHPTDEWTVGYRMATARDMQGFNSLNTVQPEMPIAVMSQGHLRTESGLHQEFSVARKTGKGFIQASYYRDNLNNVAVSGGGALSAGDLNGGTSSAQTYGVVADTTTGGFRLLTSGYNAQGVNVVLSEPLVAGIWAAVQYEDGSALAVEGPSTLTLVDAEQALHAVAGQSATLALKGTLLHTRTNVRASYRWQPAYMVTAVAPYAAFSDQAYLSFFVRQPINCGSWLPAGLEATVDVTNLLAQGYRPFLSADGRTVYLAQAPRSIQAGLAFNF